MITTWARLNVLLTHPGRGCGSGAERRARFSFAGGGPWDIAHPMPFSELSNQPPWVTVPPSNTRSPAVPALAGGELAVHLPNGDWLCHASSQARPGQSAARGSHTAHEPLLSGPPDIKTIYRFLSKVDRLLIFNIPLKTL